MSSLWHLEAEDISREDIKRFVKKRGVAPGTTNRDLALLNAVIRYAWKAGKITKAPFIKKLPAPPPKLRYLTREEVSRLLEAIKLEDWRTQVFVMIALSSGARTGAILDLTWDKVNLVEGVVDFRSADVDAYRRKGRAVVPINDMMREAIEMAHAHKSGDLVINMDGARMSSVQRMFARLSKNAQLEDFSPHVLRHTVASLLLQEGEDLLKVSRLLGHANSKTTEAVYFAHTSGYLKSSTDKLDFKKKPSGE